ncbi:MAG TPA: ABC transporter substrate-binding protein [Nitrolancea sp.]|nr:ABC transporter substrate-binding protein [Nitrolancea sp.]
MRSRSGGRLRCSILGRLLLATVVTLALIGCGGSASANPKAVTIGLTYVPNIQFAPFYVADSLGYYKDAGLKVTFHHHGASEDEFGALVAGQEDMIFAGGDEMLQAQSNGVPVVYLDQVFTQYPVAIIVPADSPIKTPADLRGHSIGVPGAYGATYIGLLALLQQGGLTQKDVNIQSIGYTQLPALMGKKVDAVMGYLNNEAVEFNEAGFAIRTIPVGNSQPLISNGLGAMQKEIDANPDVMKKVIAATQKGVDYVAAHPADAVTISAKYVPDLKDSKNAANALAVLNATIPLMKPSSGKAGATDASAWTSMATFLKDNGQLQKPVDTTKAFNNDYLP